MKALSIIWKIPDDRLPGFSNDTNGLIVVRDLCEFLGKKIESYLLLGKEYLPKMDLGNIHIVDSKSIAENFLEKTHHEIMVMVFEKALADIQPDIVHIHDSGDFCRACMEICREKQVPYIFTAHGFIEKNQTISQIYSRYIVYQEEIYTTPNINIVAVGKGVANKIMKEYPGLKENQLKVIQNGTNFKAEIIESDLKERLGLKKKKLLICPGKITYRKNQVQIIRAFHILSDDIKKHIGILFCGNDRLNGELQKTIIELNLEDSLKYVGVLSSEQMKEYYSISSGMIMASIAEGLSIAALEAMSYGLPIVMFDDLECAVDIGNEQVSCLANKRTDQGLAEAIERWACYDWNKNIILEYAKYFSMERVADEYIDYYYKIIES